jgi:hypothetical protein
VTGDEITLRDVYNQQLQGNADTAQVRADVAALKASVDVQLAHGQRKMDALERDTAARRQEIEALKERIPERLSERLTSLESDRDKGRGSSGVMKWLLAAVVTLLSGSVGAAAFALLSSLQK